MRKILFFVLLLCLGQYTKAQDAAEQPVVSALNAWHAAAGAADFKAYFALMSSDALFLGTDATERWNKVEFQAYAKPHFDNGKAWNFTPIIQHVHLEPSQSIAWVDELLQTDMKICRGTAILKLEDGQWKIAHYTLSMTVPNSMAKEVILLKDKEESSLLKDYNKKLKP